MAFLASFIPDAPPIPERLKDRPRRPAPNYRKGWLLSIPFVLIHLLPLLAFYTGTTWRDWLCCAIVYSLQMFAITAFYHRYFSHRTYKTSRWFQFVMALWGSMTVQKGVLWWASTHRAHHKYTDQPWDPHSPSHTGFWYSHILWIVDDTGETGEEHIKDLTKYPELVWLNKYWAIPTVATATIIWLILGWSGLLIGFFFACVLSFHMTFSINSITHMIGRQRFDSGDTSRNNWFLGVVTFGEGWHNNHHHYERSTRLGFYWWELDIGYYGLVLMSWLGLVWDLKSPPAAIYEEAAAPVERASVVVAEASE